MARPMEHVYVARAARILFASPCAAAAVSPSPKDYAMYSVHRCRKSAFRALRLKILRMTYGLVGDYANTVKLAAQFNAELFRRKKFTEFLAALSAALKNVLGVGLHECLEFGVDTHEIPAKA